MSEVALKYRKQLDEFVELVVVNNNKSLSYYYGMCRQILTQAHGFRERGDKARAYIFYKRFLVLAVNCIPEHLAYRDARFSQDKNWLVGVRRQALKALEEVIAAMDKEYAPPPAPAPAPADSSHIDLENRLRALRGGEASSMSLKKVIAGTDDDDVGADLDLHNELMSSSPDKRGGGGEDDDVVAPSAPPLYDDDDGFDNPTSSAEDTPKSPADLIDFETAFRALRMDTSEEAVGRGGGTRYYPVYKGHPKPAPPPSPPKLKSSESLGSFWDRRPNRLKPVVLASGLIGQFLQIAEPNTRKRPDGIETCGILAGVQDDDVVRFTTLIIPKQEGTSDTVAMTHEEELFAYCQSETRNLCVLGWIHTHPCQSCFMSAVDVHTHCPYQLILAEAVAIVVAPKDPKKQVGVFRLTEPHGLQLIQRCKLTGFHPHPSDFEIYKDHHAVRWEDSSFTVVDLRKM